MIPFRTGMDVLLRNPSALEGFKRIGLVAHPASINGMGIPSHILLRDALGERLQCLFGPEHGFYGVAPAGESVGHGEHPEWRIPIFSLYGDTTLSLAEKLSELDAIIFDLQDLSVRCYTYVSTLSQLMQASHQVGITLYVTDRPTPMMRKVDGPMRDGQVESFVAAIPAPLVYGMSPGETALWLKSFMAPDMKLRVIPCEGYDRSHTSDAEVWKTWIPPSPAIRSLASAYCYPVTVFTEAFPFLFCGRHSARAFTVLGSEAMDSVGFMGLMSKYTLPGLHLSPWREEGTNPMCGIQVHIQDARAMRPVQTAIALLLALQEMMGETSLWHEPSTRAHFFDQLMGGATTREQIIARMPLDEIVHSWKEPTEVFMRARAQHMLYV